jgi:hypothetical protein
VVAVVRELLREAVVGIYLHGSATLRLGDTSTWRQST